MLHRVLKYSAEIVVKTTLIYELQYHEVIEIRVGAFEQIGHIGVFVTVIR